MVKIAIEQPFTDIQQALQQRGYQANMINQKSEAAGYDVVVVRNVESYEGFQTDGSLVETSGRTVVEVISEVEERLQRAGKTLAPVTSITNGSVPSSGGSGFVTGLLTGAVVGAATALFLAPKTGKELQNVVKEKVSSSGSSGEGGGKLGQIKEKAAGIAGQVKDQTTGLTDKFSGSGSSGEGGGKLDQVKEKAANLAEQAKEQVNKVSGKSQDDKQDNKPDTSSTSTTKTPSTVVTTDTLNTSSTSGTSGTGTSGTTGTTGTSGTTGTTGASGTKFGSGTSDSLNTSGTSGTRGGSDSTNNNK